uniref:Uncharacterized protein n=1 Tax=Triticum urartu TaxID=4572 RepID=A0A8R7PR13_TRIUA
MKEKNAGIWRVCDTVGIRLGPKNSLGPKRNSIFCMSGTHLSTQKQGAPRSHPLLDRSCHLLDRSHHRRRPLPQHQQAAASPPDGSMSWGTRTNQT